MTRTPDGLPHPGKTGYLPIEDYGIVGDLHTVALVGTDASIDFLSFPHFDSPTIFAALLDSERGGRFGLRPCIEGGAHKQLYLPDSNILLTRFLHRDGVAEVSDFMEVGHHRDDHPHRLVRRAKAVRGDIDFDVVCAPRFDYGRADHTVEIHDDDREVVFASQGEDGLVIRLRSEVPVTVRDGAAVARFTLGTGEHAAFILEKVSPGVESPASEPGFVPRVFVETMNYWRDWIGRCTYRGRWRETVNRSALALKLMVSQTYGSLVAAPTFGLPEELGGGRNWDYRYTWIRDASFTLYSLIRLGYTEEAGRFMEWIEERIDDLEPDGSMQIMYGYDGRKELTEIELPHLEGYRGSAPVRVGNGAYDQLQLDIYGELMDSIYLYNKFGAPISSKLWENCVRIIDWVCENWERADEGIWEVRGGRHHFLFSRLMCWVAVDRGIRMADRRSFPYPFDRWRHVRDAIYRDIFTNFWDDERETFVQTKGGTATDAAYLLMPLVKFISPQDPRWWSTLGAIEEDLVDDSLVFRYRQDHGSSDGLDGDEGTFNLVSFWYAEALARAGDVRRARLVFEKMLGYANHLGLYAEELGPHGEHLGNFPQAFTHLGLISAAYAIDRKLDDAGWM
ncbi:MAG: glycoside hydrolase family 15 protein [Acidimicrobiia bacterium]